jgi:hypothetical protein
MAYFWVNQKQTWQHEYRAGLIFGRPRLVPAVSFSEVQPKTRLEGVPLSQPMNETPVQLQIGTCGGSEGC